MRETRLYGSEGGEAKAFPTPICDNGYNLTFADRCPDGQQSRSRILHDNTDNSFVKWHDFLEVPELAH